MPRLRFSLATLLLLVLLAGSAGALYVRWGPWVFEKRWENLSIHDPQNPGVVFAAYSHDGQRVVVGTELTATVYDRRTGSELVALQFPPDSGHIGWSARFSSDGRFVYIEPPRRRFDAATGVEDKDFAIRFAEVEDPDAQEMTFYSPDFTKRAVHRRGGRLVVFDGSDFSQEHVLWENSPQYLGCLFSNDSATLVAFNTSDYSLHTFDLIHLKKRAPLQRVFPVDLSPSGNRVVTQAAERNNGIDLWDISGATATLRWSYREAENFDRQAYYSPEGSRILMGGNVYANQFLILDESNGKKLATIGQPISLLKPPQMVNRSRAWRPDGAEIMLGDSDGLTFYRRTRPEWWWGVFFLPELWTTAILILGLLWRMIGFLKKQKPNSATGDKR